MSFTDAEWDEIQAFTLPPSMPTSVSSNCATPTPLSDRAAPTESRVALDNLIPAKQAELVAQSQAVSPKQKPLPKDRAHCRVCSLECKAKSLYHHWSCVTHYKNMLYSVELERFCSNRCFYGGGNSHDWVTLQEHIATAGRFIPMPMRADGCCSTCGGILLA